jgi:hypothetical protein
MKGHIDVSSRHDFGGVYSVLLVLGLEETIWEIIDIEFKNNLKMLGLWIFSFTKCSTSTFSNNMGHLTLITK